MTRRTIAMLATAAALYIVPWVIAESLLIGPDLLTVLATGTCPAGPPDVSPYPCTPWEYLLRMFLGPFSLIGQALLAGTWTMIYGAGLFCCGAAWAIARRIRAGA
jgi:hypothetical protein